MWSAEATDQPQRARPTSSTIAVNITQHFRIALHGQLQTRILLDLSSGDLTQKPLNISSTILITFLVVMADGWIYNKGRPVPPSCIGGWQAWATRREQAKRAASPFPHGMAHGARGTPRGSHARCCTAMGGATTNRPGVRSAFGPDWALARVDMGLSTLASL